MAIGGFFAVLRRFIGVVKRSPEACPREIGGDSFARSQQRFQPFQL